MNFKPFRPPSFKKKVDVPTNEPNFEPTPPNKRRKLCPANEYDTVACAGFDRPTAHGNDSTPKAERAPLKPVPNPPSPTKVPIDDGERKRYFSIVWRKVTAKKNKTWEDDGFLIYKNGLITVFNSKGHKLGSCIRDNQPEPDDVLVMSGKDVQIEAEVTYDEYCRVVGKESNNGSFKNGQDMVTWNGQPPSNTVSKAASKLSLQEQMRQQIQQSKTPAKSTAASSKPITLPQARNAAFRNPLKHCQVLPPVLAETPIPRHDPHAPSALVLKRPKNVPPSRQIVDVVLDPLLTKSLREHQREGIHFLYECVMGLRDFNGQGCILADDMGLGKTLQTIALIWTLLKQNPVYKETPVIKKVLIVCPVTLIANWKKEFRKWLGRDRVGVMSLENEGSRLSMFDGKNFQIMIVGYERLLKIVDDLNKGPGIDLIICDEGHRLKTLQNKSTKAIETLNTPRRVILSGTPIQNDLSEFFAMVNFVNDGVLGTPKAFLRDFERPIMKSRQPDATAEEIERGREASDELASTTAPFILRRTADILSGHLPLKTEYVLFCRPTREQANVYREVLQTPMFRPAMGGTSNEGAFQMITILKKLCNSPRLLKPKPGTDDATTTSSLETLNEMLPQGISRFLHNAYAAKIRLLDELLQQIRRKTSDKVVLVSNYTSTLDLIQNVVASSGMNFKRLDGNVTAKKRQVMVDEFNETSQTACFAFLLSAKAGGVGINLIGANRLILFDADWNPAIEDQAMARIHREGQKKPCYIYRLLIKGAIEERIWQRQVVKRALAESIMDGGLMTEGGGNKGKGQAQFSAEELRDLFTLDEAEGLRTHELIGCDCTGKLSSEASVDRCVDDIDELDPDEDNGDQTPRTFSLVSASQLSENEMEEQDRCFTRRAISRKSPRKKRKKDQEQYHELVTYTHIDLSEPSSLGKDECQQMQDTIGDSCLVEVLSKGRDELPSNVAYVFLKKSKEHDLVPDGKAASDQDA